MRRTSLFLDEPLLKDLRRAANRKGVSVAALIREAVATYLATGRKATAVPSIAGRFKSGTSDTSEQAEDLLWTDPHA